MVNALTLTLLAGFLTVVATIVIRLSAAPPAPPVLPEALSLPRGERARAVTLGTGWVAVVTVDATGLEHVRVFDAETGAERAAIAIEPRE